MQLGSFLEIETDALSTAEQELSECFQMAHKNESLEHLQRRCSV